ncbi:hypothetical protein [Devosia sp. MC1541]|uniref:hypothetical protein n=1 Tax=Devosia sp. MC1541 TaxID=2725264 RepID=UPI00145EE822|nr:hypothetical protein [Devosia sp. MC1541]
MVTVTATTPYSAYRDYRASTEQPATAATERQEAESTVDRPATTITLSVEAQAALAERDYATIVKDAESKLLTLLTEARRSSPLQNGSLALDLSSLDNRELFSMANDDTFNSEEKQAAGLEMERRFRAALAGPAAIAKVTGSYLALYQTAANYLSSLGTEEKSSADWQAGRDAVLKGIESLKLTPGTLPAPDSADPVRAYLALSETPETTTTPIANLASNARAALDQLYAQADANGKFPSFNRQTKIGQYIDVSAFSSRTLSSMVINKDALFTSEEAFAAKTVLAARSGATLSESFSSASSSGDPTAFSRNIIAAYSSLSAEERLAVGWSDKLYQAAVQSYASTTKIMNTLNQTAGSTASDRPTVLSFLGR